MKISIYIVKTNSSDCPPREKQAALCILAATCWAINTHTALEKIPRIMVLWEKDGINAEGRKGRDTMGQKAEFTSTEKPDSFIPQMVEQNAY